MTEAAYGEIRSDGVRFERLYDATPDELWSALTDPAELPHWLAHVSRFQLAEDGEIRLVFEEVDEMRGRVVELDPGRVLSFTWRSLGEDAESLVRFEIVPREHGVLLVLDHARLPAEAIVGYGAGWHAHLDVLAGAVPGGRRALLERYEELRPEYERRVVAARPS